MNTHPYRPVQNDSVEYCVRCGAPPTAHERLKPISLSGKKAALLAYIGDEVLHRNRGGFWARSNEVKDAHGVPATYFGTPTVMALVRSKNLDVITVAPWGPVAVRRIK